MMAFDQTQNRCTVPRWLVLTPFTRGIDVGWVPGHIPRDRHSFDVVAAHYEHDRSRDISGGREWLDYAWQAGRGIVRSWIGPKTGLITSFPQLAVCVGALKRMTGSRAPLLAWCFNMGRTYNGLKGTLARFGLQAVDLFVVHSTAEIEIYSQWLDLPRERFRFVPLSIANQVVPALSGYGDFVAALGTANRDYATLFTALTLTRHAGRIVAGATAVAGLDVPADVVVGSGLTLQQCHQISRDARVNVIPLRDVSNASGQVTVLETMAMGRPVIATRCVGTVDYIADGVNGLLVPPNDPQALAEAIERVWNDPDFARMLSEAGADFVSRHCSFASAALAMETMLDELTSPPTR